MSEAYKKDEMLSQFIGSTKNLIDYWSRQDDRSDKEKLEGLAHSIFCIFDGVSGSMSCAIDLVLRPHPEDKQYHINNDENYVDAGMCINDEIMLHELLYSGENKCQ